MKASSRLLVCLGLLAAATLGTSAVYSRRSSALRMENQALASRLDQVEHAVQEPDNRLEQLRADNAEVQRLKEENQDLPRLRNEVHQLREAAKELPALQAENQRLHGK